MMGTTKGERERDAGKEEKLPGAYSADDALLPSDRPSSISAISTSFSSSSTSSTSARLSTDSSITWQCSDVDVVLESSQEEETADATVACTVDTTSSCSFNATPDNATLMSECLMLQADEDLQSQSQSLFDMQPSTRPPHRASSAPNNPSHSHAPTADGGLTRAMSLVEEVEVDPAELLAIEQIFSSPPNSATTTSSTAANSPTSSPPTVKDIESLLMPDPGLPLSFRPRSILAATDLSSQLWCEHQLHLSLLYGRRVSPSQQEAMDRGTARHDQLEREMHDVVEVQVKGREEEWGLRFLNGVVGLHELMMVGKTRELVVMGRVRRRADERVVWIMGVIDEVERVDNLVITQRWQQEELKEQQNKLKQQHNRDNRRRRDEEERLAQLEALRREEERRRRESIRNHFPVFRWESGAIIELDGDSKAGDSGGGMGGWKERKVDKDEDDEEMEMLMRQYEELQAEVEKRRQEDQLAMEEKGRQEKQAKELERQKQEKRKNRARIRLQQSSSSFVLSDNKTRAKQTLPSVAQQRTTRMQLSVYKYMFDTLATRKPDAAASSAYTTLSSDVQLPSCLWTAKELLADMQLDGSRTFTGVMLTHLLQSGFPVHTTLLSLITLYLHTFSSLAQPSSPFLSIQYEYQHDSSPLGTSSFPFSPLDFAVDLDWQLGYWLGVRPSEGVGEGGEEWKCRRCEFVVECDRTRWSGRDGKVRERREEDERRERERCRKAAEDDERAKEEQRRKQKEEEEQKQRMDERRHVKVQLEVDGPADDESKDVVVASMETAEQAKTRRARKRRSLEEMTLTQEDELDKARKETKLHDIILIDIDE